MSGPASSGGLGSEFASFTGRKPVLDHAEFDITAMIDLVFMMNIFFLVTSVGAVMAEVDLPAARHVRAADEENSVVITMVIRGDPRSPIVFIGNENEGQAISDPDEQVERVAAAVEAGPKDAEGKISVLLKAERKVRFGDVVRVSGAVGAVENAKLYAAVLEMD